MTIVLCRRIRALILANSVIEGLLVSHAEEDRWFNKSRLTESTAYVAQRLSSLFWSSTHLKMDFFEIVIEWWSNWKPSGLIAAIYRRNDRYSADSLLIPAAAVVLCIALPHPTALLEGRLPVWPAGGHREGGWMLVIIASIHQGGSLFQWQDAVEQLLTGLLSALWPGCWRPDQVVQELSLVWEEQGVV